LIEKQKTTVRISIVFDNLHIVYCNSFKSDDNPGKAFLLINN